ncbi:MAG: hypothetical protein WDW38_009902 [Sanguina aurantia]
MRVCRPSQPPPALARGAGRLRVAWESRRGCRRAACCPLSLAPAAPGRDHRNARALCGSTRVRSWCAAVCPSHQDPHTSKAPARFVRACPHACVAGRVGRPTAHRPARGDTLPHPCGNGSGPMRSSAQVVPAAATPVCPPACKCDGFGPTYISSTWTLRTSLPVYIMAIQSVLGEWPHARYGTPAHTPLRPLALPSD